MLRKIIRTIDKCLPPDIWAWQERVLRTRVAVLLFSFDLLYGLTVFLSEALSKTPSKSALIYALLLISFDAVCLYLIKKSFSVGKLLTAYLFISLLTFTLNETLYKDQLVSPSNYTFLPVLLLTWLLLPNWKIRFFFLTWIVGWTGSFLFFPHGDRPAVESTFDIVICLFFNGFGSVCLIQIYLKIKSIMQSELDQELDWRLRSARLAEIASMTQTMHALMSQPLEAIQRHRLALMQFSSLESCDRTTRRMQREIDALVQVSQSFSWIYRAFQFEESCSASSDILFHQLQTLLGLKIKEAGWILKARPIDQAVPLSGPIPSLMLLLFSIVVQILENSPAQELKFLEIDLSRSEKDLNWTLSWPEEDECLAFFNERTQPVGTSISTLRKDLIHDLREVCEAKMQEYVQEGFRYLQISGSWCELETRAN